MEFLLIEIVLHGIKYCYSEKDWMEEKKKCKRVNTGVYSADQPHNQITNVN